MSHARDLPLLEKWSDASATIYPSLSPTSPKATNFCCCPQRRRYNLKQPRKLRQNFFDEHEHDFNYIVDDGAREAPNNQQHYTSNASNNNTTNNNNNNNNIRCTHTASDRITKTAAAAVDAVALQSPIKESEDWKQRSTLPDEAISGSNNNSNKNNTSAVVRAENSEQRAGTTATTTTTTTTTIARREQWQPRHIKSCHCNNNSQLSVSSNRETNNSCSCEQQQQQQATTRTTQQPQQQKGEDVVDALTAIIDNKSALVNDHGHRGVGGSVAHDVGAADVATATDNQETNEYRCIEQQVKQIQRLSNNNNINNKENKVSNSNKNDINNSSQPTQSKVKKNRSPTNSSCSGGSSGGCCCNYCRPPQQGKLKTNDDNSNSNNAQQQQQQQQQQLNKMTVATTTTTAGRQRNESGSMTAATAADVATTAATATATAEAATPSVTVIKTTMVKRTPNDSTIVAATTTATATKTTSTKTTTTTKAATKTATTTNESSTTITTTTHTIQNSIQKENLRQQQSNNSNNHRHNHPQSNSNNNNNRSNNHSCCNESSTTTTNRPSTMQEPTKSVKERIAAFAAGNDQLRNHDNNSKKVLRKTPCNMTKTASLAKALEAVSTTATITPATTPVTTPATKPRTTLPTTGAIIIHNNSSNQRRATSPSSTTSSSSLSSGISSAALGSSCPSAASTSGLVSSSSSGPGSGCGSASSSPTPCGSNGDHLLSSSVNNASASDAAKAPPAIVIHTDSTSTTSVATSPSAPRAVTSVAGSTGAATMPRRRSPTLNEGSSKYGSHSAALTTDKKQFLSSAHKQPAADDSITTISSPKPLAALDNLDLALSLDLNDEDGEDPYFALQEYLERVKHEINEVFELHKARQRIEQQQQQQQLKHPHEHHGDELTRSTESDSGFDSASGHNSNNNSNNNSSNNNQRLTATDEKVTTISAVNSKNDVNGHATSSVATTTTAAAQGAGAGTAAVQKMLHLDVVPDIDAAGHADAEITQTSNNQEVRMSLVNDSIPNNNNSNTSCNISDNNSTSSSSLHRLRQELQAKADAAAAAAVAVAGGRSAAAAADEVNIWANKFLRDLDNLMGSDKLSSASSLPSSTSSATPLLLSAAARAAINGRASGRSELQQQQQQRDREQSQSISNNLVLRPMKHTTIPLASFNLDGGGFGEGSNHGSSNNSRPNAANVAYLRTLSAPTPAYQQPLGDNRASMAYGNTGSNRTLAAFNGEQYYNNSNQSSNRHQQQQRTMALEPMTILKIEEAAAAAAAISSPDDRIAAGGGAQSRHKARPGSTNFVDEELQRERRQRQLEDDMETIRNDLVNRHQQLAVMESNNNNNNSSTKNNINSISGINNINSGFKNTLVASAVPTFIPKRDRINQAANTTTTNTIASLNISPSFIVMTPSKTYAGSLTTTTTTSASTGTATTSFLLNGSDATKKGSTSTIWTSEESILRSVGAVDEDNNSTSSSACEEASGVLSSGKSGISLDSSGLDNDNNESGIGTATPPKDLPYWKNAHHHHHHQNDNESVSSLDALRKMKFQKTSSVASSDDPDLLEVLSLCDEPQGDEDGDDVQALSADGSEQQRPHHPHNNRHQRDHHQHEQQQQQQQQQQQYKFRERGGNKQTSDLLQPDDDDVIVDDMDDDEVDEGHDEFETVTYCDCDCGDGDASSSSTGGAPSTGGGGGGGGSAVGDPANSSSGSGNNIDTNGVVLRRKFNAAPPIMVPYGRAQKCRSHSLDTASLPTSYQLHHHQLHHHQQHHHHLHHQPHSSQLARKLHQHLQTSRNKERVQLSLALRQEPFQSLLSPSHFHELPSPSSASLHSGHESLGIQELTTKSNSAPLLLKQERKRDDFAAQNLTLRYSRSQSDRYLAEIEAVEACKWLRAAGFPQYAQMYEDHQFPIDLTNVAKDHTNLENDQLQSLYRRLCILNRCASMRLDQSHKTQAPQKEDSDDENFALSENWTFQPHIRRWSRIGEMGLELPPAGKLNAEKTESSSKESSPDRFEDDSYNLTGAGLTLTLPVAGGGGGGGGDSTDTTLNDAADASAVRLRRTGSERFKDGAKALLRRVESIKSRRRKRQNREGIVISGPQALDLSQLGQRGSMRKPDATYSTPPSPSAVSPMHIFPKSPFFGNELKVPSHSENFLSPNRGSPKRMPTTPRSMRASPLHFFANPMPHLREGKSDDSSSYFSDSQESSAGGKLTPSLRKTPSKTRRFLQRTGKVDDIGAHSDSECHQGRKLLIKDANSSTPEVKVKKLTRGGSLNLGKDQKKRDGLRSSSFRSRSTTRNDVKTRDDGDHVKRAPPVRWHSFQMEERPHMIFRKCFSQKIDPNAIDQGFPFAAMSAGQLQIIRKLALVILTGYMERHCPTHRSGWNWELPKFIKKIKMPDYKDKKVFGVPLLLVLQRTGQTLPIAVRSAFRWLQLNALDQIGLFRKSGVKSRIIKLKELIEYSESPTECMDVFDAQQAYDVADMLKQYFRDLPESLLTTKMSETFATIFQHLPTDVRLDAVQCAVLLLPDENREILYALLEFLTLVADNAQHNQMTANNLAVCLAPSLFHNSISTGSASVSASPRRRGKGAGVPDAKELSEAKASHECLAFMIENYRKIYSATKDKINKCNFGYMEESKPVPLEALGEGMQFHNWRGYLYECTSATIKEGREKTRGWFNITSVSDPAVDIAYKKVGDGHPLRLWRCVTEVEGPPKDVLEYIIRQRASWDLNLLQSQTVKKLDERTEIFHYAVDGQLTTDFCVLRSWQTDLPRGACVIVETSIEHSKAKHSAFGSVRGVVLASRYLIEPCGGGRSRVMHLARVDIKGKTPEWYNKSYGHICSHHLSRIRHAFRHVTDGPESKV